MSDTLTDIDPSEVAQDSEPAAPRRGGRRTGEGPSMTPRAVAARERRAQAKGSSGGGGRKRNLTSEIEALLSLLAGVWAIRDPECATVLDQQAHEIAAGLNAWAQRDPKVYAMLVKWLEGGGAGALAFALWPLAAQVAGHHVVPAIERRRQQIAERQAAFDEQWVEPEPLIEEVREQTRPFIPPNIVQE